MKFDFSKIDVLRKSCVAVILVFMLHFMLGAYFAGNQFLNNISTAIPASPVGGGQPQLMLPGDQFEQLYRYSLPRHNIDIGRPLYESGYQYNLSAKTPAFSEGWVFFPFSIVHAVLSSVFGNVAAYNLIALLSFPLVGGAMYLLIFSLTRSVQAALISSLLLALLPHRTSFLFSEMVYGVDLLWPPIIIWSFENAIRTLKKRYALMFGVALFLYATSNFQALYLFAVFSLPYFVIRGFQVFGRDANSLTKKLFQACMMMVVSLPAVSYLFSIRKLIGSSGLAAGQDYAETTFYSPSINNVFTVWSGNEKTIYLGWLVFLALFIIIGIGAYGYHKFAPTLSKSNKQVAILSGAIFVITYSFCLGPNLDNLLPINIYRWYFDHIPGANGTRTPGRLMGAAGFYFALFFGLMVHFAIVGFKNIRKSSRVIWLLTIIFICGIVYNFHYTNLVMVTLEKQNKAYESIRGATGIVYTVPTQPQAPHYLNATFLYYAQKYNLHLFSGHSSMYPKTWDQIIKDFLPINDGVFDRAMMERFKARGIDYIAVHATVYEPNVIPNVLKRLEKSPFLKLKAEADGISIFSVDFGALGEQTLVPKTLLKNLKLNVDEYNKFRHVEGWYDREVYFDQLPFRWMQGRESNGVIFVRNMQLKTAEFSYWCPLNDLTIMVNGHKLVEAYKDLGAGWKRRVVNLETYGSAPYMFEFYTQNIYKVPPDSRDFGCQISDVIVH